MLEKGEWLEPAPLLLAILCCLVLSPDSVQLALASVVKVAVVGGSGGARGGQRRIV